MGSVTEVWAIGRAYETYVGRWSRLVARDFTRWLAAPAGARWLDIGCGTGALTDAVVATTEPARVEAIDRSPGFVSYARSHVSDPRASFVVADAQALPRRAASVDVAVSGLVLNFVPNPATAVAEMTRVVRSDGVVAVYVWDYAGEMQLM